MSEYTAAWPEDDESHGCGPHCPDHDTVDDVTADIADLKTLIEDAIVRSHTMGSIAREITDTVMEIVAPVVARLQEEQEATQAAYENAVRWHHAYAREIKRLGGTIPEDAPDLAETLAHLVAVYGPDAFQAAADDI